MKKQNFNKAFWSSVISLILCVSMFIGTTFAWFTDSVSSLNNIISSGTLDVELEYVNDQGKWESVKESTNVFGDTYWEPGRTAVVYFKISNMGTLALEYKIDIGVIREYTGWNKDGEEIFLSDYLVAKLVKMDNELSVFPSRQDAIDADGIPINIKKHSGSNGSLEPGEVNYLAFVVYMPENVDNKANYCGTEVPSIELGVDLFAIQLDHESDSFGPDYDKDADFAKLYGLLIEDSASININDYDFELLSTKRVDSLVHITDGSVVNIYGNTNYLVHSNGVSAAPAISADAHSEVNIYGGSYCAQEVPIIDVSDGAKVNIYRGIFSSNAFTDSAEQTNLLLNCDRSSGCEINVYGGTFVNFDPRASHLGNLVAQDHVVLTTVRDNGDVWYTVVKDEFIDYTPVFDVDGVIKALDEGKMDIIFACDVNPTPDTENLMYGKNTDKMNVNGHGATITLDGTGTEPGSNDYAYFAFIPVPGHDAEISDFYFTGEGFVEIAHHGQGGGTYVANNLVIEDLISTLHITNGGNMIAPAFSQYGTLTLNNCKMTGTTTKKDGYKPYDAGFINGTHTFIEGGEYGSIYMSHQAHVTIKNAVVDTIDSYAIITNKPLGQLTVGSGAKIGTINVIPGSYAPSIVIEEGAEVGEIVYKGVSYTLEEWLAR